MIHGKYVDAAPGQTFETVDPAIGEVLVKVAARDRQLSVLPRRRRVPPASAINGPENLRERKVDVAPSH